MTEGERLESSGARREALSWYVRESQWAQAARLAQTLDLGREAAVYFLKAGQPYDAALAFRKVNALPQCLEALAQVAESSPRYRAACVHLVLVSEQLKTPLAPLAARLQPFLATRPTSVQEASAFVSVADALASAGQAGQADTLYRQVLAAFPGNAGAQRGLTALASPPALRGATSSGLFRSAPSPAPTSRGDAVTSPFASAASPLPAVNPGATRGSSPSGVWSSGASPTPTTAAGAGVPAVQRGSSPSGVSPSGASPTAGSADAATAAQRGTSPSGLWSSGASPTPTNAGVAAAQLGSSPSGLWSSGASPTPTNAAAATTQRGSSPSGLWSSGASPTPTNAGVAAPQRGASPSGLWSTGPSPVPMTSATANLAALFASTPSPAPGRNLHSPVPFPSPLLAASTLSPAPWPVGHHTRPTGATPAPVPFGVMATPRPMPAAPRTARLGEQLVAEGRLTALQLDDVLRRAPDVGSSDVLLGDALEKAGIVSALDVARALSTITSAPWLSDDEVVGIATPEAGRVLALAEAQRLHVAPLSFVGRRLTVALRDPRDAATLEHLRAATGAEQLAPVIATSTGIERAQQKVYGREPAPAVGAPATSSGLPPLGAVFAGRYRLEALLAQGEAAVLYRAFDTALGERVGLKLLRSNGAPDGDTLARFKLEVAVLRRLNHPNVIRLYDLGTHEGHRFLTTELPDGQPLSDLLRTRGGRLPMVEGLRLLEQVCQGLQAAHASDVVHRDVRPDNIFVTTDGVARLMEFGIARNLRGQGVTLAGMLVGTPEYMAPEQTSGAASVTAATDLYALGVTAYTLFTGRPPFGGPNVVSVLMAHATSPVPPPRQHAPEVDLELEAAILRLLEKRPERRYPSAAAVGEAFADIRERLELTAG